MITPNMAFLCLLSFFLLLPFSSSKRATKAMMVFGLYSYVTRNYLAVHAGQHNALQVRKK